MTNSERELLLLIAEVVNGMISERLRDAGLMPGEGMGSSYIRKITELTERIKSEASEEQP